MFTSTFISEYSVFGCGSSAFDRNAMNKKRQNIALPQAVKEQGRSRSYRYTSLRWPIFSTNTRSRFSSIRYRIRYTPTRIRQSLRFVSFLQPRSRGSSLRARIAERIRCRCLGGMLRNVFSARCSIRIR